MCLVRKMYRMKLRKRQINNLHHSFYEDDDELSDRLKPKQKKVKVNDENSKSNSIRFGKIVNGDNGSQSQPQPIRSSLGTIIELSKRQQICLLQSLYDDVPGPSSKPPKMMKQDKPKSKPNTRFRKMVIDSNGSKRIFTSVLETKTRIVETRVSQDPGKSLKLSLSVHCELSMDLDLLSGATVIAQYMIKAIQYGKRRKMIHEMQLQRLPDPNWECQAIAEALTFYVDNTSPKDSLNLFKTGPGVKEMLSWDLVLREGKTLQEGERNPSVEEFSSKMANIMNAGLTIDPFDFTTCQLGYALIFWLAKLYTCMSKPDAGNDDVDLPNKLKIGRKHFLELHGNESDVAGLLS